MLSHKGNFGSCRFSESKDMQHTARVLVIPEGTHAAEGWLAGWLAGWHVPLQAVYDPDSSQVTTATVN
jgi:hypothetical protein